MDIMEFLQNLPGTNRFLMIMLFLLVILYLTYRNMKNRAEAERETKQKLNELRQEIRKHRNRMDEIYHRVKNDLHLVSSMIGLQVQDADRPEVADRLQQCQSRVHAIGIIYELLNESAEEERIEFKPYLDRLIFKCLQLQQNNASNIDVHTHIDSLRMDSERASCCGIIVNELLTNCYQHAFNRQSEGRIDVHFEKRDGNAQLRVKDTGSGLPDSIVDGNISSTGFDLIQTVTESELQGNIKFMNEADGANVQITFPISDAEEQRDQTPSPDRETCVT